MERENRELREAVEAPGSGRELRAPDRGGPEEETVHEPEDAGEPETPVEDLAHRQAEPKRGPWWRVRRFLGLGGP